MSRLFIAALIGLSLTAFGLTGMVDWPLWPVSLTLEYGFGVRDPFEDRTAQGKVVILAALIALNSMFWTSLVWGMLRVSPKRRNKADHR